MLGAATFARVVGGQIPYVSTEVATIVPAPAPPVCHDWYDPLKGACGVTPRDSHIPRACLGSLGIQPFSRPN